MLSGQDQLLYQYPKPEFCLTVCICNISLPFQSYGDIYSFNYQILTKCIHCKVLDQEYIPAVSTFSHSFIYSFNKYFLRSTMYQTFQVLGEQYLTKMAKIPARHEVSQLLSRVHSVVLVELISAGGMLQRCFVIAVLQFLCCND